MAVPARARERSSGDPVADDELIARWVETGPAYRTPDRARIVDHGVSVTAVISRLGPGEGDVEGVVAAYDLPLEAVAAARAYYARHKDVIDARITLDSSSFAE